MAINVFDFLGHLQQERYRTVILHATPEKSAALTLFCQKICKQTRGKYLDLLELFIHSKTLSEKIDRFNPENLRSLFLEQSQAQALLIVDRVDFLLDTWRKSERQDFYRFLDKKWDGFTENMKAKLVVCLQTSLELESLQMVDSQKQNRIYRLTDFNDIV
ncbi:MAG: hypothetical protein WCI88_06380 [Chloroflexota bacterium]